MPYLTTWLHDGICSVSDVGGNCQPLRPLTNYSDFRDGFFCWPMSLSCSGDKSPCFPLMWDINDTISKNSSEHTEHFFENFFTEYIFKSLIKPTLQFFRGNMGMREKAGEISLCGSVREKRAKCGSLPLNAGGLATMGLGRREIEEMVIEAGLKRFSFY